MSKMYHLLLLTADVISPRGLRQGDSAGRRHIDTTTACRCVTFLSPSDDHQYHRRRAMVNIDASALYFPRTFSSPDFDIITILSIRRRLRIKLFLLNIWSVMMAAYVEIGFFKGEGEMLFTVSPPGLDFFSSNDDGITRLIWRWAMNTPRKWRFARRPQRDKYMVITEYAWVLPPFYLPLRSMIAALEDW